MSCLPEADAEPTSSWLLWLDLWAQAARLPEVAGRPAEVRRALAGDDQRAGPGRPGGGRVRPGGRPGLRRDRCPRCWTGWRSRSRWRTRRWTAGRAFELSMRFVAGQLGFEWTDGGPVPRRGQPPGTLVPVPCRSRPPPGAVVIWEVVRCPVDTSSWSR